MAAESKLREHRSTFARLNKVRDEALKHARLARQLAAERRILLQVLVDAGFSQADIAREMGVSRQAIQKMLAG